MFQKGDRIDSIVFGPGTILETFFRSGDEGEFRLYVQYDRSTSFGCKYWMHTSEVTNCAWSMQPVRQERSAADVDDQIPF